MHTLNLSYCDAISDVSALVNVHTLILYESSSTLGILLYSIILYCIVLYCIVLYSNIQYYIVNKLSVATST